MYSIRFIVCILNLISNVTLYMLLDMHAGMVKVNGACVRVCKRCFKKEVHHDGMHFRKSPRGERERACGVFGTTF